MMMADSNSNSKFKVGDRVRTKGYEGTHWDGVGVVTGEYDGGYCILVRIDGVVGGFAPHELAPATLQLEAGKYYRTRDGRKVGPIERYGSNAVTAKEQIDGIQRLWWDSGVHGGEWVKNEAHLDLVAEWVDEPKSTKEILDDLEAWMAEQDVSRDNTPSATTGFTVPLCAYELADEGRQVAESYKQGYEDGYQRGRAEGADKPITVNVAVTLAETVDIPDRVAARVREALRTYYGKAA